MKHYHDEEMIGGFQATKRLFRQHAFVQRGVLGKPAVRHDLLAYPEGTIKQSIRTVLEKAGAGLGIKPYDKTGLTQGQFHYQLCKLVSPPDKDTHKPFALRAANMRGNKLRLECSVTHNGRKSATLEGFDIDMSDLRLFCAPAIVRAAFAATSVS